MKTATITGGALVALLALTSCGGNDEPADAQEADTGAQVDAETPMPTEDVAPPEEDAGEDFEPPASNSEDPFEDIPDDAPINDMESEEDITRYMLDCDDDVTIEECESGYEDSVNQDMIAYDLEACHETIAEGPGLMSCFSTVLPDDEFWALYEDTYGEPVPEEFR